MSSAFHSEGNEKKIHFTDVKLQNHKNNTATIVSYDDLRLQKKKLNIYDSTWQIITWVQDGSAGISNFTCRASVCLWACEWTERTAEQTPRHPGCMYKHLSHRTTSHHFKQKHLILSTIPASPLCCPVSTTINIHPCMQPAASWLCGDIRPWQDISDLNSDQVQEPAAS